MGAVQRIAWIWILVSFFVNLNSAKNNNLSVSQACNTTASEIRVLCWTLTNPLYHERTLSIKNSWGKRCDKTLFFSTTEDKDLGTIVLPAEEESVHSWNRVRSALEYIYENYRDSYDWVMKIHPYTYVIVENLKKFLSSTDPSMPIYYGCKLKLPPNGPVYFSGSSGFVLSKEAMRRFVNNGINQQICPEEKDETEDVKVGECMSKLSVEAGDTRDELRRERFLPLGIEAYRAKVKDDGYWYWKYLYYPSSLGYECCSETPISFSNLTPIEMFALEYYLYHVRVERL